MSAVDRLACKIGMSSEIPNQELARELATTADAAAVAEIAAGLHSGDKSVQSDCIKVLYEIGYLKPDLIAEYVDRFLGLLQSRNNRLVWGAMIALSTIASLKSRAILEQIHLVSIAMDTGSVITVDNGVKVLAAIAACEPGCSEIINYLFSHLRTCRAKEVPQHAESTLPVVTKANLNEFVTILKSRLEDMTPAQIARTNKLIKAAEKI